MNEGTQPNAPDAPLPPTNSNFANAPLSVRIQAMLDAAIACIDELFTGAVPPLCTAAEREAMCHVVWTTREAQGSPPDTVSVERLLCGLYCHGILDPTWTAVCYCSCSRSIAARSKTAGNMLYHIVFDAE